MSHSTDHSGASHGSVKTYMTGFILSIILTVIPFWMVMTGAASPAVILGTILAMAVVQVLVHLVCFLHMNTKSDEGWNMTAFEKIMDMRLSHAQSLLKSNGKLKVAECARQSGFDDVSYFCLRYRKKFGTSPALERLDTQ